MNFQICTGTNCVGSCLCERAPSFYGLVRPISINRKMPNWSVLDQISDELNIEKNICFADYWIYLAWNVSVWFLTLCMQDFLTNGKTNSAEEPSEIERSGNGQLRFYPLGLTVLISATSALISSTVTPESGTVSLWAWVERVWLVARSIHKGRRQ